MLIEICYSNLKWIMLKMLNQNNTIGKTSQSLLSQQLSQRDNNKIKAWIRARLMVNLKPIPKEWKRFVSHPESIQLNLRKLPQSHHFLQTLNYQNHILLLQWALLMKPYNRSSNLE